ncbi:hypothetical protein BR93DRAFT_935207 [Coniochaeta sp. PMI_546]|nr:hypothetical protein BR93DRAFT_935207 [Coniochaeta sp. PMI_546]
MEPFNNFDAQLQALEQSGILENQYIFSPNKAPEASSTRATSASGMNPRFPTAPRPSESFDPFAASFSQTQQADDSRRPVNIVLGGGGIETHLLMLYAKVDRMASEIQDLRRALDMQADREVRNQQEMKTSLNSLRGGLDNFMNMLTEQQQGNTPAGGGRMA